ncbi:MAG: glutamate synthase large subunit, partial [bacterium]|nr:glutamate synthase large subunit [bacterium]
MASCGVGFIASKKWIPEKEVILMGLNALKKLTHRGGLSSDLKTGDGAGVLTEIPYNFFNKFIKGNYAVGVLFMPKDISEIDKIHSIIEAILERNNSGVLAYRQVPINASILGEFAFSTMPYIEHVFIKKPQDMDSNKFEKFLYSARRAIQNAVIKEGIYKLHIPSFSSRVIVYKGLVKGSDFEIFYPDLLDPEFKSRFIIF